MADKKISLVKDLNGKSIKDLVQARTKFRQELHGLKMKHAMKGLKQTHQIRETRKNIARTNTVLTSKINANHDHVVK